MVTCECCGRPRADERGWTLTRHGDDWCPDCLRTLRAALQVELDALPEQIESDEPKASGS
jgi:hypothetical protein